MSNALRIGNLTISYEEAKRMFFLELIPKRQRGDVGDCAA